MVIRVSRASRRNLRPLRELYRKAMACQIVHDSWHERGFARSYLIRVDGDVAAYGSVGGVGDPKDIVKEFHPVEADRHDAGMLFRHLVDASGARRIEAQTNDRLLAHLLVEFAEDLEQHTRLFADDHPTSLVLEGATFRPIHRAERGNVFRHESEPVGDWVIDVGGEIVATGGLMFHYNPPYSDIYMEVAGPWRRRGVGAFLVQQLKQVSHGMHKIPAARCGAANIASYRTLERAGMVQCGWIVTGNLR